MNRRQFLASVGLTGCIGVAGCIEPIRRWRLDGEIRPESEPSDVPDPLVCEDGEYERHSRSTTGPQWGDVDDYALRVDGLSFIYGETATVSLTYVGGRRTATGSGMKFLIEVYTREGWQDARTTHVDSPGIAAPDETVQHDTPDLFEWELELTEEGLQIPDTFASMTAVCPDLQSGRYRFTYYGLDSGDDIAVAFDLNREN